MTAVLLAGTGAVGGRAARQLADTEGIDRVLVADRNESRTTTIRRVVGDAVEVVAWEPGSPIPAGVGAVACALPAPLDRAVAEAALDAGVPFASATDDAVTARRLLDLDDAAREAGVAVAIGCGLAPGLADVIARHAADALDAVDEIHVARFGSAGPACAAQATANRAAVEWRDGGWVHARAGSGRELIWFPDPVGSADCYRVESAQPALLVDAFPSIRRASMRVASRRVERLGARVPVLRRSDSEGGYGALWLEVRGRRAAARELVVYGVVDRMAIVAGTVLAVATATIAGAGGLRTSGAGAHGLGTLVQPVPFLAELARRGVKVAVFEGIAAA